ncbi:GMC family oxidoreductase [soil metagenome]
MTRHLDYDWIVIGSGFGGSVAALRLAEKGYRVLVLEAGRRFEDSDFAESTWNLRRFLWMPKLGMRGIQRITVFKDIAILSGAGVGGGSLVYANTLYRAPERFFRDEQWAGLADWQAELEAHYDTAEKMLGSARIPFDDPGDRVLREYASELGVADTHAKTNVGVHFGEGPGVVSDDPYFGGEGPPRTGCVKCGRCMIGCRYNAKNTLEKNYLWFAERRGTRIEPGRTVVDVTPSGAPDGSDGYTVAHEATGRWLRRERRRVTTRGVVFAAGALGTNHLLQSCRVGGSLPRLSHRLGYLVRTNSEALLAVTANDRSVDFSNRVAITGSIYPDADTHIETVTYGGGGGAMSTLFTLLTGQGTRVTRPLVHLRSILREPKAWLKVVFPGGWSKRTIILLVMQTLDNAIRLRPRDKFFGRGVRLQTEPDPENPSPTYIEAANDAAKRIAERLGGVPQSSITEALANIPATAHILGGAVIGADEHSGVVDRDCRAFEYENLIVCDGAAVPANPGVNPSLTITALAEHAMSKVEPKPGATPADPIPLSHPLPGSQTAVVPDDQAAEREAGIV